MNGEGRRTEKKKEKRRKNRDMMMLIYNFCKHSLIFGRLS